MKEKRLLEIEEIISELTVDLLVPIRTDKTVNKEAFDKLYLLLDELKILIKGENKINRRLVGLLFFIYTNVLAESEHAHYSSSVFIESALYVIIDVSERKKNLWYNKNYHNITERGFICITARN